MRSPKNLNLEIHYPFPPSAMIPNEKEKLRKFDSRLLRPEITMGGGGWSAYEVEVTRKCSQYPYDTDGYFIGNKRDVNNKRLRKYE